MSIFNFFMKQFCIYILFIACISSCSSPSADDAAPEKVPAETQYKVNTADSSSSPKAVDVRVYKIDSGLNGGYGYDIFMDGRLYIHQPHIPALTGNRTFITEEDAAKAGNLVAQKIRNNIMPPSLSVEELDSLGIR
jgi:hypothetical protein